MALILSSILILSLFFFSGLETVAYMLQVQPDQTPFFNICYLEQMKQMNA
jgi:hypothetical protein